MAASVFSGASKDAPRWAMMSKAGSRSLADRTIVLDCEPAGQPRQQGFGQDAHQSAQAAKLWGGGLAA
jgi:hypothetical protein